MNTAQATDTRVAGRTDPASTPTAQFLYETIYGGAIGGSAIALFFLVLDAVGGRPLLTPSVIGTALFTGVVPSPAAEVRLDMVAYFTLVHFAAFLALGAVVSKMCKWTGLSRSNPAGVVGLVFVLLTGSFLVTGWLVAPGLSGVIGLWGVLSANFVTAVAMAMFLYLEHRPDGV